MFPITKELAAFKTELEEFGVAEDDSSRAISTLRRRMFRKTQEMMKVADVSTKSFDSRVPHSIYWKYSMYNTFQPTPANKHLSNYQCSCAVSAGIHNVFHAKMLENLDDLQRRSKRTGKLQATITVEELSAMMFVGCFAVDHHDKIVTGSPYGINARADFSSKDVLQIYERWPDLIVQMIYSQPDVAIIRASIDQVRSPAPPRSSQEYAESFSDFYETFNQHFLRSGQLEDLIKVRYAKYLSEELPNKPFTFKQLAKKLDSSAKIPKAYKQDIQNAMSLTSEDAYLLAQSLSEDDFDKLAFECLDDSSCKLLLLACFETHQFARGKRLEQHTQFSATELREIQHFVLSTEAEFEFQAVFGSSTETLEHILERFLKTIDTQLSANLLTQLQNSPELLEHALEHLRSQPINFQLKVLAEAPTITVSVIDLYRQSFKAATISEEFANFLQSRRKDIDDEHWILFASHLWQRNEQNRYTRLFIEFTKPTPYSTDILVEPDSVASQLRLFMTQAGVPEDQHFGALLEACPEFVKATLSNDTTSPTFENDLYAFAAQFITTSPDIEAPALYELRKMFQSSIDLNNEVFQEHDVLIEHYKRIRIIAPVLKEDENILYAYNSAAICDAIQANIINNDAECSVIREQMTKPISSSRKLI